ncbi:MAG TPA: adenosylcobinamide-GDP ribazoletransferase [Conexibacter sp.]|nr:adenosylcobinamide-GDP ribazoletransferase [Conexibacter sp.]
MPATDATSARRNPLRTAIADLGHALAFLTILPIRVGDPGARGLAGAAAFFPLVGALVGALAGATRALTADALGPLTSSVLAVLVLEIVTGALHLDGLADTADGLGARGGGRERRLAVMRDPAVGVFGVLALLGWALLLTSALAQLSDHDALLALIAAGLTSRWAALFHAAAEEPARKDGLGAAFDVPPGSLSTATSIAVVGGLACGFAPGAVALGAALAAFAATTLLARRLLGGRTGDTLGATVALAEVAVVLALLAIQHG